MQRRGLVCSHTRVGMGAVQHLLGVPLLAHSASGGGRSILHTLLGHCHWQCHVLCSAGTAHTASLSASVQLNDMTLPLHRQPYVYLEDSVTILDASLLAMYVQCIHTVAFCSAHMVHKLVCPQVMMDCAQTATYAWDAPQLDHAQTHCPLQLSHWKPAHMLQALPTSFAIELLSSPVSYRSS